MKIEQLDKPALLRALFYGDSGTGKTTLVGTAMECENTSPLLVLNARGQPISLRSLDPQPLVVTVEKVADFNLPWEWIMRGQPRDAAGGSPSDVAFRLAVDKYLDHVKAEKFKSVAIDSITYVQRMSLSEVSGGAQKLPGDPPPQTTQQHWGRALSQLTVLVDKYYTLPIHVFITALTRHDSIPMFGVTMYYPYLWGQSSLEVPSHAELVGRLVGIESLPQQRIALIEKAFEAQGEEIPFNVLLTRGGRNFMAKWQGVTDPPDIVPDPTIQKLVDALNA